MSLRSAWLISRAWRPTWVSPISPSISARGVSAATESMTTHVERARADRACRRSRAPARPCRAGRSAARRRRRRWPWRRPGPSRARRRCRRRCRRCAGPRPRRAWPASTCPTTPGRRSRRPGPGAGRRCRGRGRAPARRWGSASMAIVRLLAHPHDRALAELLVDLGQRHLERLVTLHSCSSPRGPACWWRGPWAPIDEPRARCRPPYGEGVTEFGGGTTGA